MTIRYLLPVAAVAALVYLGVRWGIDTWRSSHAWISVVDGEGNPVPDATLEFFPFDPSPFAPSPAPLIATMEASSDPGVITLGREQVPGEALVRVSAPGYGTGFVFIESGGDVAVVSLAPPMSLQGQVLTTGGKPIAGAIVVALGGGPRGVPLVETRTGTDGRFVVDGLSSQLATVTLRIRGEGYAVADEIMWKDEEDKVIRLRRTQPVVGAIEGLEGDLSGLRVLTYKVPGVETSVLAGGGFLLDHLPPETDVQLLVRGLPPGYTHRGVRVRAGDREVKVEVTPAVNVNGRAVFADTDRPASGALVYHENGPLGREVATADSNGWFSLSGLPLGEVMIHASTNTREVNGVRGSKTIDRTGSRSLEVEEVRDLNGVDIRIY